MSAEDLKDRICRHEGFCAIPKPDAKGKWVIGFGHDITEDQAQEYASGIDTSHALDLLEADIAKVKQECAAAFPWLLGLDECRQSVIYEMVYQLGLAGVGQFKKMIAAIRDRKWDAVAKEMLDSDWHRQTPGRCEELANLMLEGLA